MDKFLEKYSNQDYKMAKDIFFTICIKKITFLYDLISFIISPKEPRPDFTKEDIDMRELRDPKNNDIILVKSPVFTNISPSYAIKNWWFMNNDEYMTLAMYEYARRYPEHDFSKNIRKINKGLTDEVIMSFANGKKKFRIMEEKGKINFYVEK